MAAREGVGSVKTNRLASFAAIMTALLLTNGCALFVPDRIHYTWAEQSGRDQSGTPAQAFAQPANSNDVIGIALSGGGSRAPSQTMMQESNLKLWTSDPGRVVEIVGMRAQAYRDVALRHTRGGSGATVTTIKMRYTDAKIDEWPASCGDRECNAQATNAHLANIPTSLKISDCDADLMELAASNVVRRALRENAAVLERVGLQW